MAVSDEVKSPPPLKKKRYSVKHNSDSSDSDISGNSDYSSESNSESLEEEKPKGKDKRKIKKEAVKVQNKDTHYKPEKANHKQSVHQDEGPNKKRRKQSVEDELPVKAHKTAVEDSGLKSAPEKEAKVSSEGTIAILTVDYKSLIEFVR